MNYLAHIYLSGDNKLLMIGNFIGDFIKGRRYGHLPLMIQQGILLHREIDDFTDHHPINARLRKLLHPQFGKYAGVYLDMFEDHFLAAGWNDFSPEMSLKMFCNKFYFDALAHYKYLPHAVRVLLPSLIISGRLQSYASLSRLQGTLALMSSRTSLPPLSREAILFLKDHYEVFKKGFYEFFPLIIEHTRIWRQEIHEDNVGSRLTDHADVFHKLTDDVLENEPLVVNK